MATRIAIMKYFDTQSLPYRAMKNHWRILQKDSRKLSLETFYSRTFRQTLTPREVVQKTLPFSEELRYYDDLYQLLRLHFQEKQASHFFDLIEEHLETVNKEFNTVFKTFLRYKDYIINTWNFPILTRSLRQPTNSSKISNDKLLDSGSSKTLKLKVSSL